MFVGDEGRIMIIYDKRGWMWKGDVRNVVENQIFLEVVKNMLMVFNCLENILLN